MTNIFIKMSDLRHKAVKRAFMHKEKSVGNKLVKSIIGLNPLKREWIEDVIKKLELAKKNNTINRVMILAQALETLYFCEWILNKNKTTDDEVSQLIIKAETMYLNSTLNFIETYMKTSDTIINSFPTILSAIEVLSEKNVKMADKYKRILAKHESLHSSFQKITSFCSPSNTKFDNMQATQIVSLISHHATAFKMYPELKKNTLDVVQTKLDEILTNSLESIELIKNTKEPSIAEIVNVLQRFVEVYKPLSQLFPQKRYAEIADKLAEYIAIKKLVTDEYSQWLAVYQYYTLPRNTIDEAKILQVIKSIDRAKEFFHFNLIEINKLSPLPSVISTSLKKILNQHGKESIINLLKVENELLSISDSDSKIEEIVKFLKFLKETIPATADSGELQEELNRMKIELSVKMDSIVETKIKQHLSSRNYKDFSNFFDKLLKYFYDLNDLTKITYWQNVKKMILRAMNEVPEMMELLQNDYEFYQTLPESPAKQILKDKISIKINEINEIVPYMVLFQLKDTQKVLTMINEIEENLTIKSLPINHVSHVSDSEHLIILDKFTNKNVIIFKKDIVNIGREIEGNDIILKSSWVSSNHCSINFAEKLLIDEESTNGTFVNDAKTLIQRVELRHIKQFNVAEAFDISVAENKGYYHLKVTKIYDNEVEINNKKYVQNLFNTDFLWMKKYSSIEIDSNTGNICPLSETNTQISNLVITLDDNFTIIDNDAAKSFGSLKSNEEINTDRYTICYK